MGPVFQTHLGRSPWSILGSPLGTHSCGCIGHQSRLLWLPRKALQAWGRNFSVCRLQRRRRIAGWPAMSKIFLLLLLAHLWPQVALLYCQDACGGQSGTSNRCACRVKTVFKARKWGVTHVSVAQCTTIYTRYSIKVLCMHVLCCS
jgi:hypothetical protein